MNFQFLQETIHQANVVRDILPDAKDLPELIKGAEMAERMKNVWFFFKLCEASLGFVCMGIHAYGILDDQQPLPHKMYFCGPYFGFTAITIFSIIGTSMGLKVSLYMETLISMAATFFYIVASILSMYYAEQDPQLMYLSNYGEAVHPFFKISKWQSIASLYTGCIFMLHTVYTLDARITVEETTEFPVPKGDAPIAKEDYKCYQPIDMYIFGERVHAHLMQLAWFQRIVGYDLVRFIDKKGKVRKMKESLIF